MMPPSANRLRRSGSSSRLRVCSFEDFEHPLLRRASRRSGQERASGQAGLDEVERIDASLDGRQDARGVAGIATFRRWPEAHRLLPDRRQLPSNLGGEILRAFWSAASPSSRNMQRQRPVACPALDRDVDVVASLRQRMIERVVGGDLLSAGASCAVELRKANIAAAVDHACQAGLNDGSCFP